MKFVLKIAIILLLLLNNSVFAAVEKNLVKVAISNQSFSTFEHKKASFFSSGDILIVDMSKGDNFNAPNGSIINVELIDGLFCIKIDENVLVDKTFGPIVLSANNLISIENLKRKGLQASYGGQFELKLTKNLTTFNILNVLDTNSYLKGVVPNEMPVSFGLEALKAQAVAARNYVNRPQNPNSNYDVCDSTACQVYFGANTYNPLSNKAVEQTSGVFALYKNEPILALYSSTAGGITESYDNVYGEATAFSPQRVLPYMKSVGQKLNSEADVKNYYSSVPNSPDMKSPLYRWKVEWEREELEDVLNKTLYEQSRAGLVEPKVEADFKIEELQDIKVLKRGDSGKALLIEIKAKNGTWLVRKELGIRRLLKKTGKALYSANFYIEKTENKPVLTEIFSADHTFSPTLEKITLIGGGYGHGVGMSQYGAGFMASEGKDFVDILKYYYTNVSVGTLPQSYVGGSREDIKFYYDKKMNKKVIFKIDNTKKLNKLEFYINQLAFKPDMTAFSGKILWFDVTKYLKSGNNEIIIMPLSERDRGKQPNFWVEFVN